MPKTIAGVAVLSTQNLEELRRIIAAEDEVIAMIKDMAEDGIDFGDRIDKARNIRNTALALVKRFFPESDVAGMEYA